MREVELLFCRIMSIVHLVRDPGSIQNLRGFLEVFVVTFRGFRCLIIFMHCPFCRPSKYERKEEFDGDSSKVWNLKI